MKKIHHLLLSFISAALFICSCSSDDSAYNPYDEQEKVPFFPKSIEIIKNSSKRTISETWTFEYDTNNKITAYTRTTVTDFRKEGYTETTTEKEDGKLSYYPDGSILNKLTTEKNISGFEYNKYQKEEIIENVKCENGLITSIERRIDSYDQNGVKESSTKTDRTFTYSSGYCISSTYTADDARAGNTTYTFNWDSSYKLNSVVINQNSSDRTRNTHKYTYKKVNDNHIFHTSAFVYNHLPQVYAAMGYLGKECPYEIYREEQNSKLFIDGKWENDYSSTDDKIYTLINNEDEMKYDISSDIFSRNYSIKFIK